MSCVSVGAFMLEPRPSIYTHETNSSGALIRDQCQTLPIGDGVPGKFGCPKPQVPGIAFGALGKLKDLRRCKAWKFTRIRDTIVGML